MNNMMMIIPINIPIDIPIVIPIDIPILIYQTYSEPTLNIL